MGKIIIVTGGIASGKSFVTICLTKLGYPVLRSDDIVNEITYREDFIKEVSAKCNLIGINNITELKIAIEKQPEILSVMERILYPKVRMLRNEWIKQHMQEKSLLVIEIPLFFEKNIASTLNGHQLVIISTICNKDLQIKRARKRNKKITDKMINLLISQQISNEERVDRSTFVIYTEYRKSVVKKQLNKILTLVNERST